LWELNINIQIIGGRNMLKTQSIVSGLISLVIGAGVVGAIGVNASNEEHVKTVKAENKAKRYAEELNDKSQELSTTQKQLSKTIKQVDEAKKSFEEQQKKNVTLNEAHKKTLAELDKVKKELEQSKQNQKKAVVVNETKTETKAEPKVTQQTETKTVEKKTATDKETQDDSPRRQLTFHASAYSTAENGDQYVSPKWGGITATGTKPAQGRTIAVDKNVIPLGTKVNIDFPAPYDYMDGTYTAEDTGNAINGNRIDVYFDSIQVANNFGRRDIVVSY
jgi:3D (Asp-Asp-Asp) domain-containing protein